MENKEQSKFIPDPEREKILEEQPRREKLIRRYVEGRVIALAPDFDAEDLTDEFSGFSTVEKTNLLYEKLMARYNVLQQMREAEKQNPDVGPAPINPRLLAEIKTLWDDASVADQFCRRFSDARVDAKLYRLSELGSQYQGIIAKIEDKRQRYDNLSRTVLSGDEREDDESSTRSELRGAARGLIRLERQLDEVVNLDGIPEIPENTDVSAMVQYEALKKYRREADEGFSWLPCFEELEKDIKKRLENSRWPVLIGEAGTGKSQLAESATIALTGKPSTKLACLNSTGEKDILGTLELDEQGSYMAYGAAMSAISGFTDSHHKIPNPDGPFVRLDEFLRLSSRPFGIFKELKQLKPGKQYKGEMVPPNFRLIGATNPAEGARYPDCNPIDPALAREFDFIEVDYPPMSVDDPQLYEFLIAMALKKNGNISMDKGEIAPAYETEEITPQTLGVFLEENYGLSVEDPRLVTGKDKIVQDPTDARHGTMWRLAFAIRAVQDAFSNHYKTDSKSDDLLHFSRNNGNQIQIGSGGPETLTLASSTITLDDARHWVEDYLHRFEKTDETYHVESFDKWISIALERYTAGQMDSGDKEKLEAIFEHFHLLKPGQRRENGEPLTPREIGYLSPRVPRPLHLKHPQPESEEAEAEESKPEPQPEAELYSATELTLEDGSKVLVNTENISFISKDNQTIQLYPGSVFNLSADRVRFKGIVDSSDPRPGYHGKPVIETDITLGGGLHRIVELGEIAENGEDFWSLEKLTTEEIEKQLGEWKTVYEKLDLAGFTLPTREELMAYLSDNPEFIELLKTKEQQGFTKMVIAPLELKPIIDKLDAQTKNQGGSERYLSDTWTAMLANESEIRYSATISTDANGKDVAAGGETMDQMKASPWEHGILNDCLVSFVKERQNLLKSGDADETDSTGRKEIKGGLTPRAYLETYFSDKDSNYHGEDAMLPQEWLALFADDLYQKYVKDNRQMPAGTSVTDLLDTQTATWFTSTHLPGRERLPYAIWGSGDRYLYFNGNRPVDTSAYLAPRPSVRKSL